MQQITSRIACDEVDLVLFFRDPLKADAASITEQNLLLSLIHILMALADGAGSALGTGGMTTKLRAARMVTGSGADMVIANGAHPELLYDIAAGRPAGTRFAGRKEV